LKTLRFVDGAAMPMLGLGTLYGLLGQARIRPAMNQVELHPTCSRRGYSPLGIGLLLDGHQIGGRGLYVHEDGRAAGVVAEAAIRALHGAGDGGHHHRPGKGRVEDQVCSG
jgi:hypothetical protein